MTRICFICHRVFGEKCPVCGAEGVPQEGDVFGCPTKDCIDGWIRGAGGVTHGICPACARERKHENLGGGNDDAGFYKLSHE